MTAYFNRWYNRTTINDEVRLMHLLKIILFVIGITFCLFGYLIVFKRQYGLINDFKARKKAGSQKDADAIRIGQVELILGIGLLVLFVLLMIFT